MGTVWIGGGVRCGWEAGDEGEGDCDARDWCLAVICVSALSFFLLILYRSKSGFGDSGTYLLIPVGTAAKLLLSITLNWD